MQLREYYHLTKPGIIRGNLIVAAAGFLFAAKGNIDWLVFLSMLGGLGLIIAGACVFNNYLDRDIDAKMNRTKNRALVAGSISSRNALVFATVLAGLGSVILAVQTNQTAWSTAVAGLFLYVVVYGIAKRRTVWGTVIGSIAGATPPVVGYTAVTGRLNLVAVILFLILVFWQMPHFYAIAIYRLKDYQAAKIPVLPAVKSLKTTKVQIIGYVYAFIAATAGLHIFGHTSNLYLLLMLALGAIWIYKAIDGFKRFDSVVWAKSMFGYSLIVLSAWSVLISIDSYVR